MRVCIWVVDCLDRDTVDVFKASLKKAVNVTQLTRLPLEDVRVGLCYVRFNDALNLELKFLLRPEVISLASFHAAVDQLQSSEKSSDQQKLAAVLKAVVERMMVAVDPYKMKEEIVKEIHVVSKALECGKAMTKLLRIAEERDIHIRFHAFIDDRPMGVHRDNDVPSVERMHERFASEVDEMEYVSFRSTIGSAVAVDRMMMSWIGDFFKSTAFPLTLCFQKMRPELRFPCIACNRHLDLCSKLQTMTVCNCHNEPIDNSHRCRVSNTVLQPKDCRENEKVMGLGDSQIRLCPSSVMSGRLGDEADDMACLFVRRRLRKDHLGRHHLGGSIEIHYDVLTEDDQFREVFVDFCKATIINGEVLLAEGTVDLHVGCRCHFLQHYALVPAQDGSMLYAFRISPSDECLPCAIVRLPIETTSERLQEAKNRLQTLPVAASLDAFSVESDVHSIMDQLISEHRSQR